MPVEEERRSTFVQTKRYREQMIEQGCRGNEDIFSIYGNGIRKAARENRPA